MKTYYQTPTTEVVEIELEGSVMGISIGGVTDGGDAVDSNYTITVTVPSVGGN